MKTLSLGLAQLKKLNKKVGDKILIPHIPTENGQEQGFVKILAFVVQRKSNPKNGNVWFETWIPCEIIINNKVIGRTILNTSQIDEPDYCHPEVLKDAWVNKLINDHSVIIG